MACSCSVPENKHPFEAAARRSNSSVYCSAIAGNLGTRRREGNTKENFTATTCFLEVMVKRGGERERGGQKGMIEKARRVRDQA